MAFHTRPVYILISLENLSKFGRVEDALMVSSCDYSAFESLKNQYVLVCKREVSFETQDNIMGMAVEKMEQVLEETRAKHHKEQQDMIDSIARLRQIGAPKEGELVDDRDLSKVHFYPVNRRDDDADDAEFNDLPF